MATYKKKIELKRVNVNLPSALAKRVEEYAEKKCLNSTTSYTILLTQALDQQETLESLPVILDAIKIVFNENTLETKAED